VPDNKPVCVIIGLYGYNNLFQHKLFHLANFSILYFSFKVNNIMKKLPIQFYKGTNVVQIAKELIGKIVVTNLNGLITSGRIVETEAYIGLTDRASHSFGGRRTARNEHMYAPAGTAYVYICYGMHHLFNIVSNAQNVPDAVLIRAVEPFEGIDIMLKRTGKPKLDNTLTKGPGNAAKALGISKNHSGINLMKDEIYLAEDGFEVTEAAIGISRRIGVESSREAALLPYRFYIKGNIFVSSYPNK
jgi:DNA-3-methyladenine glycosylase